ncbi:hypothetical protein TNCV_522871 [Trichonephila clavipes]|nr:hypothetical protein TNCV_522871 [Trichonephila clavipes]
MAFSCASGSYTNAGRSVSSPKETTLKVDVLLCYELFRTDHLIGASAHVPQHPIVAYVEMGTVGLGRHGLLHH